MTGQAVKQAPGFILSAFRLGLLGLAASLLGFMREILIVRKFGASPVTDAYIAAYSVPLLFFSLSFGSGMSLALVPRLSAQHADSPPLADRSFGEFLSIAMLPGILLTLFLILFRAPLIHLFTPGLREPTLAGTFLATLAPAYYLLLAATSFGVYQCARHATHLFGFLNLIQNGIVVAGLAFMGRTMGIQALIVFTLAAHAGSFLFQLAMAKRAGFNERWTPPRRDSGGARLFLMLLPFLLTLGIGESGTSLADIVLVRYFGSLLEPGAITLLSLGNKLAGMPAVLIGAAMGTALLPAASRLASAGDSAGLASKFRLAMTTAALLTTPLVIVYFDAPQLVAAVVLTGSGLPAAQTTELISILRSYAPAIAGWTYVYVMCSVLAATGSTIYLIVSGIVTLSCGALMMRFFSLWLGAPGIALAVSAATFLYLAVLAVRLPARLHPGSWTGFLRPAAIVLLGAAGMHLLVLAFHRSLPPAAIISVALMFYAIWSIINRGSLHLREVFQS
ncbi:MAG TPA: lipid II flippase MurJ [Bryobacteraceae bacterium]|jgi:putative peptidoglycan lipid II flippase|nr:lipid II flippase MurJ [Bryobacteraceae bacterium]